MLNRANIWETLADHLSDPELLPASGGLWGEIRPLPGGLWQSAREETLVLGRSGKNIWSFAHNQTVMLQPARNIWQTINALSFESEGEDLWERLEEETLLLRR